MRNDCLYNCDTMRRSFLRRTRDALCASGGRASTTHERFLAGRFLFAFGDDVGRQENGAIDGDRESSVSSSDHDRDLCVDSSQSRFSRASEATKLTKTSFESVVSSPLSDVFFCRRSVSVVAQWGRSRMQIRAKLKTDVRRSKTEAVGSVSTDCLERDGEDGDEGSLGVDD